MCISTYMNLTHEFNEDTTSGQYAAYIFSALVAVRIAFHPFIGFNCGFPSFHDDLWFSKPQ